MTFRTLIAITATALFAAGCGKKSEPSPAPTAAESAPATARAEDSSAARSQEPTAPISRVSAPSPTPAPPATAQPDMSATLGRLTEAVRRFSMENRRVPTSLSEVVAAGYVNGLPQAPYGKKFAIDPKQVQVVLVNQ